MAEYGEASLWEGHRKTIQLPSMPELPEKTRDTAWLTALSALIEAGQDVADYTLGQALETAGLSDIPAALYTLPMRRPTT